MLEFIRGLVRPTVAWAMIISFIAFEAVSVFRGHTVSTAFVALAALIIRDYFKAREDEKRNENNQ